MNGQTLSIRRVGIDTWRENVAYLHRDCPVVRAAGFRAPSEVSVQGDGAALLGLRRGTVLADGRQPAGSGTGPVLESRDVMQVLAGDPRAPKQFRRHALRLAGRVIGFDPGAGFQVGPSQRMPRDIASGAAGLA